MQYKMEVTAGKVTRVLVVGHELDCRFSHHSVGVGGVSIEQSKHARLLAPGLTPVLLDEAVLRYPAPVPFFPSSIIYAAPSPPLQFRQNDRGECGCEGFAHQAACNRPPQLVHGVIVLKGKRDLPGRSDNHFHQARFSLGTAIASPNANGFLDAGVDLAGFLADWLVVPEGVLLPVEGLALEELLGNGGKFFIAKGTQAARVNRCKVHYSYPQYGTFLGAISRYRFPRYRIILAASFFRCCLVPLLCGLR